MSKSEFERVIDRKCVRAECTFGGPENASFKDSQPWTVRLRYKGRQYTVPFYMGSALCREPTAADVLSCLLSDATSYENAHDFEDWAGELGYDTDSRTAEKVYKACGKVCSRLRVFLGDDFDDFVSASADF